MDNKKNEMWAIVELMGHGITAGIIKTSDLGGLLRVDVPIEDSFMTQYYGENAIYSIKIVSEEIARAYALPERQVISYNEPIVPRAKYESALQKSRQEMHRLNEQIKVLSERLTSVNTPLIQDKIDRLEDYGDDDEDEPSYWGKE